MRAGAARSLRAPVAGWVGASSKWEVCFNACVRIETLSIDPRFCGPPDCGNGGYVAGRLARHLEGSCEVTLRAPAPLGTALEVHRVDRGELELRAGDDLIARARPAQLTLEAPAAPSHAEAEKRAGSCRAFATHPFPRCFVCGPAREPGDGLRVLPGWFPERRLAAAPWTPEGLPGGGEAIDPVFVWAALDSPSAFPLLEDPDSARLEPMVLGRLAAHIERTPRPGEPCVVLAWTIGSEGRRAIAGSALWSEAHGLCAVARATWVSLAPG